MLNYKLYYTLIICFLVLLLGFTGLTWNAKKTIDMSCASFFHQTGFDTKYQMHSNTIFNFFSNGTGMVSMDGEVEVNKISFTLRRDYYFNYNYIGKNTFQLSNIQVQPTGRDSVPEKYLAKNFFNTSNSSGRYLYINEVEGMEKVYIIGGIYSPAFACTSF